MAAVTLEGSVVKHVRCGCGHVYAYEMHREAVGTYSGLALTQAGANEKAAKEAAIDLARMLATECDMCPCPKCGAVTPEMQAQRAQARSDHGPVALGSLLIGAALCAGVYLIWKATGRVYYVLGLFGAFGIVTGLGMIFNGYQDGTVPALPNDDPRAQLESDAPASSGAKDAVFR